MKDPFSQWPGAWERHLIRRHSHPHFFGQLPPLTENQLQHAQQLDQQELAAFHLSLQSLIERCTELNEKSSVETITRIKKDLDQCHDTAFGLGADLTEQKNAIALLNEVITTAMRRALQDCDDGMRLRLIQNEGNRLAKLSQLEHTVVCDILHKENPIPAEELPATLLCETEAGYKAALEVLDIKIKKDLADRLDTIKSTLETEPHLEQANRKIEILNKQLPVIEDAMSG